MKARQLSRCKLQEPRWLYFEANEAWASRALTTWVLPWSQMWVMFKVFAELLGGALAPSIKTTSAVFISIPPLLNLPTPQLWYGSGHFLKQTRGNWVEDTFTVVLNGIYLFIWLLVISLSLLVGWVEVVLRNTPTALTHPAWWQEGAVLGVLSLHNCVPQCLSPEKSGELSRNKLENIRSQNLVCKTVKWRIGFLTSGQN